MYLLLVEGLGKSYPHTFRDSRDSHSSPMVRLCPQNSCSASILLLSLFMLSIVVTISILLEDLVESMVWGKRFFFSSQLYLVVFCVLSMLLRSVVFTLLVQGLRMGAYPVYPGGWSVETLKQMDPVTDMVYLLSYFVLLFLFFFPRKKLFKFILSDMIQFDSLLGIEGSKLSLYVSILVDHFLSHFRQSIDAIFQYGFFSEIIRTL